jgi:hypothetical protein
MMHRVSLCVDQYLKKFSPSLPFVSYRRGFLSQAIPRSHFLSWNLPGRANCTRSAVLDGPAEVDPITVAASICSGVAGCDVVTPTTSVVSSVQQGQSDSAELGVGDAAVWRSVN